VDRFFLIGANKAGTTSVHSYLGAHPEVFTTAVKEPSYFAVPPGETPRDEFSGSIVTSRGEYDALFADAGDAHIAGESSTAYLYSPVAADRIHAEFPDAKILAVLRDPSDRAHSAHAMYLAHGAAVPRRLEDAVAEELAGRSQHVFVRGGRYAHCLTRYLDRFPREQVRVFLYEDLSHDPQAMLREIFEWFGVSPEVRPDVSRRENVTLVPTNSSVYRVATSSTGPAAAVRAAVPPSVRAWTRRRLERTRRPDPLTPELRARLIEYYDDDIRSVEHLIGRDLTAWRTV